MNATPQQPTLPSRKRLPHGRPMFSDAVYFITVCSAKRGDNTLAVPSVAEALWHEWAVYREQGACFPHLFLVMPDHVHGLFSFPTDREMAKIVGCWKRLTARRVGVEWQRDFFDHRLRSDESFGQRVAYIRENPVRAGLAQTPEQWRYAWSMNRYGE